MLPMVTVEGRVAGEPELRFAPSGMAVGKLRLVASSRKKNDAGEWVDDKTLWIDATMFRQLAENVVESVVKGDLVTVVGKLQTDEWEDKDTGAKRSKITMIAESVAVSLQFRTVKHSEGRSSRPASGGASVTDDPWATGPAQPSGGFADDPPF